MKLLCFIRDIFTSPYYMALKYKQNQNNKPAVFIVILTSLSTCFWKGNMDWISAITINFSLTLGLYFAACTAFKLAAEVNNKKVGFGEIMSTWGFSYAPTIGFIIFIIITHTLFLNVRLGLGTPESIILMTIALSLLMWKAIFYFIELRAVLKLNWYEMILASVVIGALFTICYAAAGSIFGMKIPIV